MGPLQEDPLPSHQERIHFRILVDLYYDNARVVPYCPFGNSGYTGFGKYDNALHRKWQRAEGGCGYLPVGCANTWRKLVDQQISQR